MSRCCHEEELSSAVLPAGEEGAPSEPCDGT